MGLLSLVLLAAVAGWLGWRAFARERDRVARELRGKNRRPVEATTLERDPETGTYRARDDRA
jgi:hypothetical protein